MENFRLARIAEADAILALYREAAAFGKDNGSSVWDDEYPNREILDDDLAHGRLFVLEDGGAIMAAISMLEDDDIEHDDLAWTDARYCVPVRLCVSPKLQGQGLGERMMRLLAAHAKAEGYLATRHMAAVGNLAALRLYERMGYRRMGPVAIYGGQYYAYEYLL